MLTEVILNSANPMSLKFTDASPTDLVAIKSISGLAPVDFTLFTGQFASDGGYYQGRRLGVRNPVFTLRLKPDYATGVSVAEIRELLQAQYFTPTPGSDGLQMVFKDPEKPDRFLTGVVEKFESDLFTKETTVQVSVICPQPLFTSVDPTVLTAPGGGWATVVVPYDGLAPTGFKWTGEVNTSSLAEVKLQNGSQTMRLVGPFALNTVIEVDSNDRARSIKVNGVNRLAVMAPESRWLKFSPGGNTIVTFGSTAGDGLVTTTKIEFQSKWWGV